MAELKSGTLVYYKQKAAVVTALTDKIEILFFKTTKRVRDKDIVVLHPGPISDVDSLDLEIPNTDSLETLEETLELIEDEAVTLEDLADYLYGDYTPQTAWSTWMLVVDGLYFEGNVNEITARPLDVIQEEKAKREAKQAQKAAWNALIERIKNGKILEEDRTHLVEVEQLACGERENSRIMKTIGLSENKEEAHRLLLRLNYWQESYNPWPRRHQIELSNPDIDIPPALECERQDLQHLQTWAIDDVGNQDPDDAISLHNGRLYVHIADVSSLVTPDSELDIEARSRGTNLYLPDQIIHMLPKGITEQLGLGLQDTSPALTISFIIDEEGEINDVSICFSTIKVTRTTYADADNELDTTFADIKAITDRYHQRRVKNNAANLELPEVNVKVIDGEIKIEPFTHTGSRQLVGECMMAAGEAIAKFAEDNNIPLPFAYQPEPEEIQQPEKPSEHYAYRRQFKPSRHATTAAPHFGLGLPRYARVTSPLRRYLDLVVHQQIRAFLTGQELLDNDALLNRIGIAEEASLAARKTERYSNQHWKLLYLKANKDWQGEAIVVAIDERNITVITPTLALEPRLRRKDPVTLDESLQIQVTSVDIPDLRANFRIVN